MCHHDKTEKSKGLKSPSKAQVVFLLPVVASCLRLFGFKKTYVWLGYLAKIFACKPVAKESAQTRAKHIAGIITCSNRQYSFYPAACLAESLTLWMLLRLRGIQADFRLGVRTITGPFESHAWVEYDGIVLNDIGNVNRIYDPFDLSPITPGMKSS